MKLVIGHLYPELMNVYGDRGNVIALAQRCRWRGIEIEVQNVSLGQPLDPTSIDILFIGGGQDREQKSVAEDLQKEKGMSIIKAVDQGTVLLGICGGYQLLGNYFKTGDGITLPGIGLFDIRTEAGDRRCIGDIIVECDFNGRKQQLIGFENHSGKTYPGHKAKPLGRVLVGFGNNAGDGTEGSIYNNAYGTYLHGSLLPKNPWFADHLIATALRRRYGEVRLKPINDETEQLAHNAAAEHIRHRGRLNTGAR